MIPLVNSLEEAIEHVAQPDVKEELQYQFQRYNERLENVKTLKDRIEELECALEEAESDLEGANEAADENEDAADDLEAIRLSLVSCSGVITAEGAQTYLNQVLRILGADKEVTVSDTEYEKQAIAF